MGMKPEVSHDLSAPRAIADRPRLVRAHGMLLVCVAGLVWRYRKLATK